MRVVIAGGHGQIARQLGAVLVERGEQVTGLIRNPEHRSDLEAIGMEAELCDLERDDPRLVELVSGAAAVVFAAGAGPGSGVARKWTMDRDGAVRLIDACRRSGVRRYLMVSAMGARPGAARGGEEVFAAYLEAKAQADEALAASGLDYTILRPGRLTDEPAGHLIALAPELARGAIPRADVALTLAEVLGAPNTVGQALDLVSGPTPIAEAVAAI